jgi:hypothetical protein
MAPKKSFLWVSLIITISIVVNPGRTTVTAIPPNLPEASEPNPANGALLSYNVAL